MEKNILTLNKVFRSPFILNDMKDVKISLTVSPNPLEIRTGYTVLSIGAYEENEEYFDEGILKQNAGILFDNKDYQKASYGDIVELVIESDEYIYPFIHKYHYFLMVLPIKLHLSIEKELDMLRRCCYKVFESAMKEYPYEITFILRPDEPSSLPLLVRFYVLKQIALETLREFNKRCPSNCKYSNSCLVAKQFTYTCPAKHKCPTKINFCIDYHSIADVNTYNNPSREVQKRIEKIINDLVWLSKYDYTLDELLETVIHKPGVPEELVKFKRILDRYPETKSKIKETGKLQTELYSERKEYWDAHVRKTTPEDFAWHYLNKTIKKWIEDNAIPQNKIASTLMNRSFLEKNKIYGIVKSPNTKPTISFLDRKELFLLAAAMELNETDRRKLISVKEPAMLYPSSDEENQWEICLKDMLERVNKDRDNYEIELLNMLMELTKYGTKYQIFDKKKINKLIQQREEKASEKRNKEDQKDAELERR